MSLSLEQLPVALTTMHHDLCNSLNDAVRVGSIKREYCINELAVDVIVIMKRTENSVPKGASFCGGKLSEDKVTVTVIPSNEKVEQVVASHFKSQIIPAMMGAPEMSMFDEVTINKKNVLMNEVYNLTVMRHKSLASIKDCDSIKKSCVIL